MDKYILDDEIAAFVDRCEAFYGDAPSDMTAEQQRVSYNEQCRSFDAPHPDDVTSHDDTVPGLSGPIPIRIYRPDVSGLPGCLIYFHGGGWVLGGLDSHDAITAEIASRAGVVVIAVDYRLAPEHIYPAGHDDGWSVVKAVAENSEIYGIDPTKLAVGGDSAGGTIAAAMALKAHAKGGPILAGQILLYGAFGGIDFLPSYVECSDAPLLSTADMHVYHAYYFGSRALPDDPLACPLKAENLEGLPPTFLQAAQYDPLRDDSVEYGRRLEAAGVAVELHIEQGLIHGFLRARHVSDRGAEAFTRICDATRRLIGN